MGLDIRWPMGLLLLLLGGILAVYGLVSAPETFQRSQGLNINLWWGGALMLVGVVMVALARRAGAKQAVAGRLPPADRR